MRGIAWLAKEMLASQNGAWSIELLGGILGWYDMGFSFHDFLAIFKDGMAMGRHGVWE
jgi:hypothetical protein